MAKVKLENVRIGFCQHIFAPGGEYNRCDAQFMFPPKHPAAKLIDAVIEVAAKEKWKDKAPAILAKIVKDGNSCYGKEDYLDKNGEPYDGFAGMYHIGAWNKVKPLVIDRDKSPLTQADGRPYAGCYVNAQIDVWIQDNTFGRRINASLSGIQFLKDGDAFTGGQPADPDSFDDLSEQGEEESADDLVN